MDPVDCSVNIASKIDFTQIIDFKQYAENSRILRVYLTVVWPNWMSKWSPKPMFFGQCWFNANQFNKSVTANSNSRMHHRKLILPSQDKITTQACNNFVGYTVHIVTTRGMDESSSNDIVKLSTTHKSYASHLGKGMKIINKHFGLRKNWCWKKWVARTCISNLVWPHQEEIPVNQWSSSNNSLR